MSTMSTILEISDLTKFFGGLGAVRNFDLTLKKGDLNGLIGPNGAGKTTVFNLITGIYEPTAGDIVFNNTSIVGLEPFEITRLGIARTFQNIRLAVLSKRGHRFNFFRRVDSLAEITRETEEILHRINLDGERNMPAGVLSYGKHRSLEISLALATDPDLIMLDEPTAGMSRDETRQAVELIRRLTEGRTLIIIEHDMDVVFSLADRITVLNYGQILATGAPAEIRENQAVKEAYLGELKI